MGSPANSASPVRRLLPIAGAPAALAGIAAAAFAFSNTHAAAPAVTDAVVRGSAAAAATPQLKVSSTQLASVTRESATGLPVVRLDATKLAAIRPRGKHHRAQPSHYTVKSGDTLGSIAARLYHSAGYWPALYSANHGTIKYADEITVGQVLTVPDKPAKVPSAPQVLVPTSASTTITVGYASASTAKATIATTPAASTYTGAASSFQACVIARESGGNAQVMNGSGHYGLYQFSASTWAAYGGNPADFGDATVAEQNQVFDSAIAAGGESNWSAYDGC